jgi:hypothetical protein
MGPFARENGQSAQSHKVKRELVIPGFDDEKPKLVKVRCQRNWRCYSWSLNWKERASANVECNTNNNRRIVFPLGKGVSLLAYRAPSIFEFASLAP